MEIMIINKLEIKEIIIECKTTSLRIKKLLMKKNFKIFIVNN